MGKSNFSEDFKRDAVHLIAVRGFAVHEISKRSGVSAQLLYKWMKLYGRAASHAAFVDHEAKNRRLKRELTRMTEARDTKKGSRILREGCKMKHALVAEIMTAKVQNEIFAPASGILRIKEVADAVVPKGAVIGVVE